MAPRGDAKLFSCFLFIICCCCTVTFGQMAMDCCLRVKDKKVDKRIVADYHQQFSGQGCGIDATVLVTRGNKRLCVPSHPAWVQEVMNYVIGLRKKCKENYQAGSCIGVKRV